MILVASLHTNIGLRISDKSLDIRDVCIIDCPVNLYSATAQPRVHRASEIRLLSSLASSTGSLRTSPNHSTHGHESRVLVQLFLHPSTWLHQQLSRSPGAPTTRILFAFPRRTRRPSKSFTEQYRIQHCSLRPRRCFLGCRLARQQGWNLVFLTRGHK